MNWTREDLMEASELTLPPRPRPLPWYARLLLGLGGWVAASFMLGFGVLCMLGTEEAWIPVGGAVLLSAVFLQRSAFGRTWADDALEQGALALGLAGRGLVFAGLVHAVDLRAAAVVMPLVELLLLVAFPTSLQRIASAMSIPTLWLVALDAPDHPWVTEAVGVVTTVVALLAFAARHAVDRRAARLEAPRLWGHRTADLRLVSGLASDVGMGLALWTMGLEAFRFGGYGGGLPFGLLYSVVAAVVLLWLAASHPLSARQRLAVAIGVVVLIGVGSQVPGLPVAVAFALVAVRTRHTVLAGLSLAFVVAYGGLFYYQLSATLAVKGAALAGGGVAVLGLRALAGVSSPRQRGPRTGWVWRGAMAVAMLGTLGLVGVQVAASEVRLAGASTVYLELAPRDPRSLVQGDYMVLGYRLDTEASRLRSHDTLVGRVDPDGVIRDLRAPDDRPLAPDERLLRRPRFDSEAALATDSFLFQEGHAEAYTLARYGSFALSPAGQLTLVGLADANLEPLGAPRRRW